MHKRIYILYSEVMPYMVAVWKVLVENFYCELVIVHWDKKKLTPYNFTGLKAKIINRSEITREKMTEILKSFKPDIVYVSGRMDSEYLRVAGVAKRNGLVVVMGSDKQWVGNWKNYLAMFLSRFLYRPYFTHAWVPGNLQFLYAQRVGFQTSRIINNLYSGNIEFFNSLFTERLHHKTRDVLFIGRLAEEKGILPLVGVLTKLKDSGAFAGNLHIYGNGVIMDLLPKYDWIIIHGFADQLNLRQGILSSSLFCLPSLSEPWGVVIHEMAAAGLPICCSSACGAAELFVKHEYNGYIFQKGDWKGLSDYLTKMFMLPDSELVEMGKRSNKLAQQLTPFVSAQSLLSILTENKG